MCVTVCVCALSKCRERFSYTYTPPLWFVLSAALSLPALYVIGHRIRSRMSNCVRVLFELAMFAGTFGVFLCMVSQHDHITDAMHGCAHDGFATHAGSGTTCVFMCSMWMIVCLVYACPLFSSGVMEVCERSLHEETEILDEETQQILDEEMQQILDEKTQQILDERSARMREGILLCGVIDQSCK